MADNNDFWDGVVDVAIDFGLDYFDDWVKNRVASDGSASAISKVNGPKTIGYGDDLGPTIPVVYGEVLINPMRIDSGTLRSEIDPGRVLKKYVFVFGEGKNVGIVGDTEFDKLNNIYINCKPVRDKKDDKTWLGDFSLGEIFDLAADGYDLLDNWFDLPTVDDVIDLIVGEEDPISGEKIPTIEEAREYFQGLDKVETKLAQLADVDVSDIDDGHILVFDKASMTWVTRAQGVSAETTTTSTDPNAIIDHAIAQHEYDYHNSITSDTQSPTGKHYLHVYNHTQEEVSKNYPALELDYYPRSLDIEGSKVYVSEADKIHVYDLDKSGSKYIEVKTLCNDGLEDFGNKSAWNSQNLAVLSTGSNSKELPKLCTGDGEDDNTTGGEVTSSCDSEEGHNVIWYNKPQITEGWIEPTDEEKYAKGALLKTQTTTNTIETTFDMLGHEVLRLHFYLKGLYRKEWWNIQSPGESKPTTQDNPVPCSTVPTFYKRYKDVSIGPLYNHKAASIKVQWCLFATICGTEEKIAEGEADLSGQNNFGFNQHVDIDLFGENACLSKNYLDTLKKNPTVKVKVTRIYDAANKEEASTQIYYTGYSLPKYNESLLKPRSKPAKSLPQINSSNQFKFELPKFPDPKDQDPTIKDDGMQPQFEYVKNYTDVNCGQSTLYNGTKPPNPNPAPPAPGTKPQYTPTNTTTNITSSNTKRNGPIITPIEPVTATYAHNQSSVLPDFDITCSTTECIAVFTMQDKAFGALWCSNLPAGVTETQLSDGKRLQLYGNVADVIEACKHIEYTAVDLDADILTYSYSVTDGDGNTMISDKLLEIVPESAVVPAKSATAKLLLSGTNGSINILYNGKSILQDPVSFTSTLENFRQDVSININANTAAPNFTATYEEPYVVVTAPKSLGADINGKSFQYVTSGDIVMDGGTFSGGQNQQGPANTGFWDDVSDFLGLKPGATLGSMIPPLLGIGSIVIPAIFGDDKDNDDNISSNNPDKIAVLYRGRKVKVPNNYDTTARTYSGSWDYATFKEEYTNNPAWCLLDYIQNKAYGCGDIIKTANATEITNLYTQIYDIAQYCDEFVDNGEGGLVPRYTLNAVVKGDETRQEIMQQLASVFHGRVFWHDGQINVFCDKPASVGLLVNQTNASEEGFSYGGASMKSLYNTVNVQWSNPDNFFKEDLAIVEDRESILEYGERTITETAWGATNKPQAVRHARWVMETEKTNPLIVNYKAGLDHAFVKPGDLVCIADPEIFDERRGGRIKSITGSEVEIDSSTTVIPVGGKIYIQGVDLVPQVFTILSNSGTTLTLDGSPTATPDAVFNIMTDAEYDDSIYRVTRVAQEGPFTFSVSAMKHDVDKYNRIDNNIELGV